MDIRSENSDINYHNVNTPRDYNNGYPVMNDGVFPASYTNTPYTNTPAYINTPGNVINSDLSQSYPPVYNDQNATQFFQTILHYLTHSI
ncbi:unnamed protein product [Rhizophagus irregularis]|nr:unnamed protein product [Rhizophagus irregularis]